AQDAAIAQGIQQTARFLEADVDGVRIIGIGPIGPGPHPVDVKPDAESVSHGQAPVRVGERDMERLIGVDLEIERDAALVVARDVAVLENAALVVVDDRARPGSGLEGILLGVRARHVDQRGQRPEDQTDCPHQPPPASPRRAPARRVSSCLLQYYREIVNRTTPARLTNTKRYSVVEAPGRIRNRRQSIDGGTAMPKTMRAAVLRKLKTPLKIEAVPVPEPKAGQVLIKVAAC